MKDRLTINVTNSCAVSHSNEVNVLGIKMAQPLFQMAALAKQHGIIALSSNYSLYGDLSARVRSILSTFSPKQEIYSIDE
jgi:DNA polymerase V